MTETSILIIKGMKTAGLSLNRTARRAGMTPPALHSIIHGKTKNPSFKSIVALSQVLDIPITEFAQVLGYEIIPTTKTEDLPVVA